MTIAQEIAQLLKIDITTANKIQEALEYDFFDFSEASTASLKRAARAALKELAR